MCSSNRSSSSNRSNRLNGAERLNGLNGLNLQGGYMGKTVALVAYSLLSLTSAFAQTPFYQDKTITIIQGREPGALGDSRVRAVIPFLKKYILGNHALVSEYMLDAGGRT